MMTSIFFKIIIHLNQNEKMIKVMIKMQIKLLKLPRWQMTNTIMLNQDLENGEYCKFSS